MPLKKAAAWGQLHRGRDGCLGTRFKCGQTGGAQEQLSPRVLTRRDRELGAARCSLEVVPWYNREYYHSGLGMLTPAMVHHQKAEEIMARRQAVLNAAYAAHPERLVNQRPTPARVPACGMDQSAQQMAGEGGEHERSEPNRTTCK